MAGKPPKDIRDRREQGKQSEKQPVEKGQLRNTISKSWKLVGVAVTLLATSLGIVTGYLSLVPKISVSQNQPLNPNELFSTPFIISNDGPLGINNIDFVCWMRDIQVGASAIKNVGLTSPSLHAEGMEPGERATYPCGPTVSLHPLTSADVVFEVKFRPDFVPWRISRRFRFVTMQTSDGQLVWYPQPFNRLNQK